MSRWVNWVKKPLKVLAIGISLSVVTTIGMALLFPTPPECPLNYTQQQVDASGCTIGATIHLEYLLPVAVLVATVTWAMISLLVGFAKKGRKDGQAADVVDNKSEPQRAITSNQTKLTKLPWHPAIAVVIVVVLFFAAQILAAVMMGLLFWTDGRQAGAEFLTGSVLRQFLYVLLAEAFTLGGLAWVLRRKKLGFRALGLTRPKLVDIVYSIVGLGAYVAVFVSLVSIVSLLIPGLDINQKQDIGFDSAKGFMALVPVFISLVILAPVAEEILMRGFLFGSLRPRMSFVAATLITSVVFASAHLAGGEQGASLLWIAAIDTFVLSFALCYLREKTGRLWACIGLHALKNGVAFVLLFVLHIS